VEDIAASAGKPAVGLIATVIGMRSRFSALAAYSASRRMR
jgi:hypothetical protein